MRSGVVVVALLAHQASAWCDELPPAGAPGQQAPAPEVQPQQVLPHGSSEQPRYRIEYRWPRWIPWTLVGTGVGLGVAGALLYASAQDLESEYDRQIASACAVNGCNLSNPSSPAEQQLANELNSMRDKAESRHTLAAVTLVTAGVGLVTGIVLVALNHPYVRAVKVDVAPTPGGAAAFATLRF